MPVRHIRVIDIYIFVNARHVIRHSHQIGGPQGKFGKKPATGKGSKHVGASIHHKTSLRNPPTASRNSLTYALRLSDFGVISTSSAFGI